MTKHCDVACRCSICAIQDNSSSHETVRFISAGNVCLKFLCTSALHDKQYTLQFEA